MRITLFGYGNVGGAIGAAALRAGHQVAFATNPADPTRAARVVTATPALAGATACAPREAVADADLVVLAVPFPALETLLPGLAADLAGRIVVDATNPVGPRLTHGLLSTESGAERVSALLPGAQVVKAFNVYGWENLDQPPAGPPGVGPVMPYAGDDAAAKARVAELLTSLGWEPLDAGPLAAAVDLEHLTLLWIRMVRGGGLSPRLVWAALREDGR